MIPFQNFSKLSVFDYRERQREVYPSRLNENPCPSIRSSLYLCIFINSLEFIGTRKGLCIQLNAPPYTPSSHHLITTLIRHSFSRIRVKISTSSFHSSSRENEGGWDWFNRGRLKGVRFSEPGFSFFLSFFFFLRFYYYYYYHLLLRR